jgi:hypothetical protein
LAQQADSLGVITFGLAILAVSVPATWKAVNLRAETNRRWGTRVDDIRAKLEDKILSSLFELQVNLEATLKHAHSSHSGIFDGRLLFTNPAALSLPVREYTTLLQGRDKLGPRLRRLRFFAQMLLWAVVMFDLGWMLWVIHIADLATARWAGVVGASIWAVSLTAILICFMIYAYVVQCLTRTEELSGGSLGE